MQKIYPVLIMVLFINACNHSQTTGNLVSRNINNNNIIESLGNPDSPKRALVIGNSQYTHQPLNNSTNDAIDMANTLVEMDFYVTRAINLNKNNMEKLIKDFHKDVGNIPQSTHQKVALFYFSGHGARSNRDENYIIPTNNEKIKRDYDLRRQAFHIRTEVKDQMETVNSDGVNIIIADACRDNPYEGSEKSLKRGLKRMETSSKGGGAVIAFAADEGETADDGDGNNGLYTKYLLEKMRENKHKPIDEVFMDVYEPVVHESKDQQHPWYLSTLEDDFCLDGCDIN
jgi:uncharacterized caspase-like protein